MAFWNGRYCDTCPPNDFCQATQKPCPIWIEEAAPIDPATWAALRPRTPVYGWAIPNRLYGAEINIEGDVV